MRERGRILAPRTPIWSMHVVGKVDRRVCLIFQASAGEQGCVHLFPLPYGRGSSGETFPYHAGRTPAEPYPPDDNQESTAKEPWRPEPEHPWRKFYIKRKTKEPDIPACRTVRWCSAQPPRPSAPAPSAFDCRSTGSSWGWRRSSLCLATSCTSRCDTVVGTCQTNTTARSSLMFCCSGPKGRPGFSRARKGPESIRPCL